MAGVRDRTEDLKDTVRAVALSLEYEDSKIASIQSSFIIRKPKQKSPFTKAALKTGESIEALDKFIVKHRKDYVERNRTSEQERDSIEHEVGVFIKACKEQIDILQRRIKDEDKNGTSRPWLGIISDNSQADLVAHRHGVVLILSERLHVVTAKFDQLRAIRFQEAVNRATPRRKPQKVSVSHSSDASRSTRAEVRELDEFPPEPLRVQQQLLDDETQALQVELSSLLDTVQETETKMVEMSALNHLMATHVLQQAQQIEFLYDQAVEATNNVAMGNKELTQAVGRNSSSKTFLLLFLFVLTFSVLFLDWYS
ncbi:hypothetical protein MKW94_018504 [Papaver nudicaule]|uniref:SNARE-complex protein Syntaxin-18 N-terminal domain-containing protein n=1 Tax=Papaver nudicaule TaxID=74823 RepID=A0AA41RQF8_PAPNU|nr:hypothetical protein [Papaver nudicaule]